MKGVGTSTIIPQMMSRVCQPRDDERSGCFLLYPQTRKDVYKKFFEEGTYNGKRFSQLVKTFNKIQTQVFQALYMSDEIVFIGVPIDSGKALLSLLCSDL
ncbi:hypothetical protein ARMGADRAFT_934442 [Armillaria gallica]|uniref:Uncharacterized protein n=1 Tax=Armillaria gallica TaxID=47427 RepID=A0A2H3D473_ARMGA|nr:hypothetical protein ARMGADRAFT_934442 [Armillaria gallica]